MTKKKKPQDLVGRGGKRQGSGRPPKPPADPALKLEVRTLNLTAHDWAWLEAMAAQRNTSMSQVARAAIDSYRTALEIP